MHTYLLSFGKAYIKHFTGLPKTCWQGIFLSLSESTFMGVFYFLSVYFTTILHFNIATAGSIISCYGIGAIAGGFVGGRLSDKLSPAKISAYSLMIQAIGYLMLIKITTLHLLMLDVFFLGTAAYSFITSNYLWVLSQCKNNESQKLKSINLLSTASNLGLGISAIIISLMYNYGFKNIFLISGALILLLAFYIFFQEKKELKEPDQIESAQEIRNEIKTNHDKYVKWLILACVLLIGSIVSQLSSTYPVFIQNAFPEMGIKSVSILFTINSLLVILFETPIGNIFGNYNKILMVGIGSFFIGLGMFLLSLSFSFSLAIASCVIYTFGEIIFFCMAQFIYYQRAPRKRKGHGLGIYRMVYASSRVIGPAIGGLIYHHFGSNMIWYLSGIIGLLCLISCNYYKKYN
jgi:predicted MFS family arabinose efflux permease